MYPHARRVSPHVRRVSPPHARRVVVVVGLDTLRDHPLDTRRTAPDLPCAAPPRPKSLSFFTLPPQFSFFLPLLGVLSLNFGGVFEDRDPKMCTFGISGCRPAALGPPGFQTTARELQTCTFQGPGACRDQHLENLLNHSHN